MRLFLQICPFGYILVEELSGPEFYELLRDGIVAAHLYFFEVCDDLFNISLAVVDPRFIRYLDEDHPVHFRDVLGGVVPFQHLCPSELPPP